MSHEDNPNAFLEIIPDLPIKKKKGGLGKLGELANPVQTKFWEHIAEMRKKRKPVRRIQIKIRQLASFSTAVGAALWADCLAHEETDCVVTAHRPDSLDALSRMYRRFAGEKKSSSARRADRLYRAESGSYVTLQSANEDLGRSDSVTHAHVSEADYIENFNDAWDSFEPVMSDAWWSIVVLETTTKRGVDTEFRAFVEAAARGELPPWEVDFTAWHDLPDLRKPLTRKEAQYFEENASDYERMLRLKLGLQWEQVAWWHEKLLSGARGRVETMMENYPSTLEEAMAGSVGAEFFHEDARRFYESQVREPELRYIIGYEGMRQTEDPRDYIDQPHLAVWSPPKAGHRYVIGGDGADADQRLDSEAGSECYAVVLDYATGEVCAEWHGYANAQQFAVALWKMAQYYNHALIVPEYNASSGVIDHLTNALQYMSVYERESFGAVVFRQPGVFGFLTNGQTRPIWVGRLQDNYNRKALVIPSATLQKQLVAFGKRRGRPQKKQVRKTQTPDDGCVALAMCMFGHQNAVNGTWQAKDGFDVDNALKLDITQTERAISARNRIIVPGLFDDPDEDRREQAAARRFMDLS